MNDSPTPADPGPVDPDAELASALLDGEAGPDERARAEDAAVSVHLSGLEEVIGQVRDVPPAPAGLLDDQVTRALASFDDQATVVPMRATRGGTSWWQRIPLGAVAAALVVVALVSAVSLANRGGGDDDTATAASDEAVEDTTGDDASANSGSTDDSAAARTTRAEQEAGSGAGEAAAGRARQVYGDYEQLAADIRDELAAGAAPTAAPDDADGQEPAATGAGEAEVASDPSNPCGAVGLLGVDPAAVVLVRSVVVGPDDVTVVVRDADDGRRLAIVDDATCTVVLDRLL